MQHRDWRIRITDILDAINKIQRFVTGLSFAIFCADEKTVDAVVYNIAVIGEAARHIPAELETQNANIPWAVMRGMRNVVIHQYFGIDTAILWETVQQNLPPLVPLLQALLDKNGE